MNVCTAKKCTNQNVSKRIFSPAKKFQFNSILNILKKDINDKIHHEKNSHAHFTTLFENIICIYDCKTCSERCL